MISLPLEIKHTHVIGVGPDPTFVAVKRVETDADWSAQNLGKLMAEFGMGVTATPMSWLVWVAVVLQYDKRVPLAVRNQVQRLFEKRLISNPA